MIPAVFFDRDGILVQAPIVQGRPHSARTVDEIRMIPAAFQLCEVLREARIPTFMITNQPDIARGLIERSVVDEQNQIVARALNLTEVAVCPHDDGDDCYCRKPRPGLIEKLGQKHRINLSTSVVVGDRWRDIDAGVAAGTLTLFIDYGYEERRPKNPTRTVHSTDEMLNAVLGLLHLNRHQRKEQP